MKGSNFQESREDHVSAAFPSGPECAHLPKTQGLRSIQRQIFTLSDRAVCPQQHCPGCRLLLLPRRSDRQSAYRSGAQSQRKADGRDGFLPDGLRPSPEAFSIRWKVGHSMWLGAGQTIACLSPSRMECSEQASMRQPVWRDFWRAERGNGTVASSIPELARRVPNGVEA